MLRLVRDDDDMENDAEQDAPTRDAELSGAEESGGEPRAASDADERADGPVEDEAAEAADAAAPDVTVDLPALEALLFGTHHPLTAGRLAELLDLPGTRAVRKGIAQLNQQYADGGRSFRIEQVAGGYQMLTVPTYGPILRKLHEKEIDAKLSKAALETLAIIAYKQPILRAEVEAIRGVACGETIRNLMEKHLVRIAGRAEEVGRPILYGTTRRFLEVFGLNSLTDLPKPEDLAAKATA